MQTCPFCKEQIKEDAIKCRYCSSILNVEEDKNKEQKDKITYIVDRDLIRYAKFSISILVTLIIVGAIFYGFDLKQALRDVKDIETETKKIAKEAEDIKIKSAETLVKAKQISTEAEAKLSEITQKKDEAFGIVSKMHLPVNGTSNREEIDNLLSKYFKNILTPNQFSELEKNIAENKLGKLTVVEVQSLIVQDINKASIFFRQKNLNFPKLTFSIENDLNNVFWDGEKLIFGMGMVNSDIFGPYESGVVFHELTHSLFEIKFEGQSGAISESICDVMAVLIRGDGWTLGKVRTGSVGESQPLRSLQFPGEAYDSPIIGKDAQVNNMKNYVNAKSFTASNDFGYIHLNNGILNKAAYLISEGGSFGGQDIPKGIGRDKLLQLYVKAIKEVPQSANLKFKDFRDMIIRIAKSEFSERNISEIVEQGFRAVGL